MLRRAILAVLLATPVAQAQEPEPEVIYEAVTELDFEDAEVTAALQRPNGTILFELRGATYNPLIRLREDFRIETARSVQQVQ